MNTLFAKITSALSTAVAIVAALTLAGLGSAVVAKLATLWLFRTSKQVQHVID